MVFARNDFHLNNLIYYTFSKYLFYHIFEALGLHVISKVKLRRNEFCNSLTIKLNFEKVQRAIK